MSDILVCYSSEYIEILNYNYISDAAKTLNGAAFKLYIYLFEQMTPNYFEFSFSRFVKDFGGGLTSAKRGFKELLEHNYLVLQKDGTYLFLFANDQNGLI